MDRSGAGGQRKDERSWAVREPPLHVCGYVETVRSGRHERRAVASLRRPRHLVCSRHVSTRTSPSGEIRHTPSIRRRIPTTRRRAAPGARAGSKPAPTDLLVIRTRTAYDRHHERCADISLAHATRRRFSYAQTPWGRVRNPPMTDPHLTCGRLTPNPSPYRPSHSVADLPTNLPITDLPAPKPCTYGFQTRPTTTRPSTISARYPPVTDPSATPHCPRNHLRTDHVGAVREPPNDEPRVDEIRRNRPDTLKPTYSRSDANTRSRSSPVRTVLFAHSMQVACRFSGCSLR
jgi:hypothetical protein